MYVMICNINYYSFKYFCFLRSEVGDYLVWLTLELVYLRFWESGGYKTLELCVSVLLIQVMVKRQ